MNRLHPLSAVSLAIQRGITGLSMPFFAVMILSSVFDFVDVGWTFVLAPIGLVVGVGYGIAYYYRFSYEVTSDTFDVTSGVLSRRSREIPYGRIQNVDVARGVLQRALGLAVVSIETAGGGETEATLRFVSEDEANRLQRDIRRRTAEVKRRRREREATGGESEATQSAADADIDDPTAGTADGSPAPTADSPRAGSATADSQPNSEPGSSPSADRTPAEPAPERSRRQQLFALEPRELLLYSLSSFRPAAGAGLLFLFFIASDAIVEYLLAVAQPLGGPADLESGSVGSYGILTLVSLVNGIVVTYVLNVGYTFVAYYDFRLGRADEDFVYERGLFQRYSGSIPADKIQAVTITDNPIQRLLGYAGLWVETAGYGPDSSGGSQSAVPLAAASRIRQFAENLTGADPSRFRSPPTLARRRYLVRYALIAAVIVAAAFGLAQVSSLERWYLAAVAFAAVPPAAHLRYAHLGYVVGEDHLVIRTGFWKRRTTVIPYYRIQTVSTRRSIFQRRLGLASLTVDTASSRTFAWDTPTIYDIDLADARAVNETSRENLQVALRERARGDGALSVDFTDRP
ncbi:PH domain-containing protein [Natrinema amylolyticum]|uniref:PH domain-containing protein n=1 Tax=Natrinema amylolyticum TaxID=2878679 RepID=UPI001CFA8C6E|nr:PH domain-containing protein [Natrinema amylolyticum]